MYSIKVYSYFMLYRLIISKRKNNNNYSKCLPIVRIEVHYTRIIAYYTVVVGFAGYTTVCAIYTEQMFACAFALAWHCAICQVQLMGQYAHKQNKCSPLPPLFLLGWKFPSF